MKKFFSCDWGTSSLRVRLVDADTLTVLSETESSDGVLSVFNEWQKGGSDPHERIFFYQSVLKKQIEILEVRPSPRDTPVIISGMASSSIGMTELSYKEIPFNLKADDLVFQLIEPADTFEHSTLLISGIKATDDVIRGEETQLLGCWDVDDNNELFIFPGTHSKHVVVKNGIVTGFKTFMTGEFFELLSKKSILSNAVEEDNNLKDEANLKNFKAGVEDSRHSNLLHNSFKTRTNHLFGKRSKKENFHYLSGLLIGTELHELANAKMQIGIIANELQTGIYLTALDQLGIVQVKHHDSLKAVIKGHAKILSRYRSNFDAK